jgi:hypothetical protein
MEPEALQTCVSELNDELDDGNDGLAEKEKRGEGLSKCKVSVAAV